MRQCRESCERKTRFRLKSKSTLEISNVGCVVDKEEIEEVDYPGGPI